MGGKAPQPPWPLQQHQGLAVGRVRRFAEQNKPQIKAYCLANCFVLWLLYSLDKNDRIL
jgi:hypothetical protein